MASGTYQHIEHGFGPVFDGNSNILILGSFPSVKSRDQSFYYGNPQNRFWDVMASLCKEDAPDVADIDGKRAMMLRHGVALWDVIESCDIVGSSDSSIKNVEPIDIGRMLASTSLSAIACNGSTSHRLYRMHLQDKTGMEALLLPSTSPANASWRLDGLIDAWGKALSGYII